MDTASVYMTTEAAESHMQETGRAGRDGLPASAMLYVVPHPSSRFQDDAMKEYCKNKDMCR